MNEYENEFSHYTLQTLKTARLHIKNKVISTKNKCRLESIFNLNIVILIIK